jgi:hypothetical protein
MFKPEQFLHPKAILIRKEIKNYFKITCNLFVLFVSSADSQYKPVLLPVKNIRSISESK